ncbi:MAG TPA: outer membrane lipoprotein carrier protein LolA [Spirochaetes bacterium]|nr:outer membrane lipoprotein carrier protein LolA [Spirochaetota bacterium]
MKCAKRQTTAVLAAVFLLSMAVGAPAYKFEFITVSDIVKKVKEKFGTVNSYQANFKIVSEKMGKKSHQSGSVRYKSSDKMLIEFTQPHGQKVIANGSTMWIYIPSMNVVAEQDLKSGSDTLFSANSKSGLQRLFSKYHYKFASKEQPEVQSDNTKKYTLFLQQKESRGGFRTMKLWISEDFLITRAVGETSAGKKVDIEFTGIRTDIDLPNGIFKFDIPPRVRVIKNPMMSEE